MTGIRADLDAEMARLREASEDDHPYGPWAGGSKAQGGRPVSGGGGFDKEQAKKHLAQARKDGRDEFYAEHVHAAHRTGTYAVQEYLDGAKPIASHTEGDMTVHVMGMRAGKNHHIYEKKGMEPVAAGVWMDFPEKHWNISDDDYYSLSIGKRASMEAKEQAVKWAPQQYAGRWLETYAPVTYDEKYLNFKRGPGGDSRYKKGGWKELQKKAAHGDKAALRQMQQEEARTMAEVRATWGEA